jgi:hypothetical protein
MILALWAHPRSVSTAFERMFLARGDFEVVHEPFWTSYFSVEEHRRQRGGPTPADLATPTQVVASLQEAASRQAVFFKDMARHVRPHADHDFLRTFVNTFIVRHPRLALASLAEMLPDFTEEETGYEQQCHLFEQVMAVTGHAPPVIVAEELRARPEAVVRTYCEAVGIPFLARSLAWSPLWLPAWDQSKKWHRRAADSVGILPPAAPTDDRLVTEDARVGRIYERCVRWYDRLAEYRLTP